MWDAVSGQAGQGGGPVVGHVGRQGRGDPVLSEPDVTLEAQNASSRGTRTMDGVNAPAAGPPIAVGAFACSHVTLTASLAFHSRWVAGVRRQSLPRVPTDPGDRLDSAPARSGL
jgi:hypothetical protein